MKKPLPHQHFKFLSTGNEAVDKRPKTEQQAEIDEQVKAYLDNGGKIKKIEAEPEAPIKARIRDSFFTIGE